MSNPFKPYDPETDGWLISPPPPAQTKQEEPEKPKPSSSKSEDKKSAKSSKPKSNPDTQSKKPKPFPANEGPDKFTDPKTGFFIVPGQTPEPEPEEPPKTKGLMYQPKPKKKDDFWIGRYSKNSGLDKNSGQDKPKFIMPPIFKRDDEKGLIYNPDTNEAVARITPSGKVEVIPFDFSAYEQEYQAKNPAAEQNAPQKFANKPNSFEKYMGISPTSPLDRPLDNPAYNQPAMPPKSESGKPKDYVHNSNAAKTGTEGPVISKDPFLEGLYGDDYDVMMKRRFIEPDPFLQGLNGEEGIYKGGNLGYDGDQAWGKNPVMQQNAPQKFVSKTTPIDKFMGVSPASPLDRPLDNPAYNQSAMPPKPESGKPKDYVHNPDGRKTYDFRDPHVSAADYIFNKGDPLEAGPVITDPNAGYRYKRERIAELKDLLAHEALANTKYVPKPEGGMETVYSDNYLRYAAELKQLEKEAPNAIQKTLQQVAQATGRLFVNNNPEQSALDASIKEKEKRLKELKKSNSAENEAEIWQLEASIQEDRAKKDELYYQQKAEQRNQLEAQASGDADFEYFRKKGEQLFKDRNDIAFITEEMTPEETGTLYYYMGKDDTNSARAYQLAIERDVAARRTAKVYRYNKEFANEHKVLGAISNIGSSIGQMAGLAEGGIQLVKNAVTGEYEPLNKNSGLFYPTVVNQATQEGLTQGLTGAKKAAAELGLALGQFAPVTLMGKFGAPVMGLNAAGRATYDAAQREATPEQAMIEAIGTGGLTYLAGKISLKNLFNAAATGKPAIEAVGNILKQSGLNLSIGAVSSYADTLLDIAAMGGKSEYALYNKDLMDMGFSPEEARQLTDKEFFVNRPMKAAGYGAAVGAVFSTAANAAGAVRSKWLGGGDEFIPNGRGAGAKQPAGIDKSGKMEYDGSEGVGSNTVTYRRVQGGAGARASQQRIIVNEDGTISIPNKNANLNISIDNGEHATYFRDSARGRNADIVEFEVPKWFDDLLDENAVPQINYKINPNNQGGMAPKIVDRTKPGRAVELPAPWIEWLEEYARNARYKIN